MTDEERKNRVRYESVNAMAEIVKWYKKFKRKLEYEK